MKILLTSLLFAPSIGGIETVSRVLAQEFVKAGHTVKLVTMTPGENGMTDGFEVVRKPSLGQLWQLAKWCDVYVQNNISLPLAWPLLVLRRPWIIVHQTWIPKPRGFSGLNNRLKLLLLRFGKSISISRAVAESLPVASRQIPNPYEASLFQVKESIARSQDLVALGRLVSDKGFDLLLEALSLLAREGLRPKLTLIGDGPEKEALIRQARDLQISEQITFLGAMTGMALVEELNRHAIAVIPSRWKEPFGVVALEVIACGCVPVGSREGGLADAIGPCGVTFPNGDAPALARALAHLLNEPESLAGYRKLAEEHLGEHHAAQIARHYLNFFASTL